MLVWYFVSPSSIPDRRQYRGIHSSTPLHYSTLNPLDPLNSSPTNSEPESIAVSAALFFAPSKSMPACYHHHQETLAPDHRVDRS